METHKEQLRARSALTALIRNIRSVRKAIITARTWNTALFDKINGDDAALESLVNHDILFDTLTAVEQQQLRREIMDKLAMQELAAYSKLRGTLTSYLSGLDKSLENRAVDTKRIEAAIAGSSKVSGDMHSLLASSMASQVYSKKDATKVVDAFNRAERFIATITPLLGRVLSETDDTSIDVDEDNSTAAEPEKIERAEPNPEPLEHTILSPKPEEDKDSSDMLHEIGAVASANRSMAECLSTFVRGKATMEKLGYTSVEDIVGTLKSINTSLERYMETVNNLRALIPVETGTTDELGYGTEQFYDTFDKVMDLVGKCENTRENLDKTSLTLVEALESLALSPDAVLKVLDNEI